jgi:hypothetical protein
MAHSAPSAIVKSMPGIERYARAIGALDPTARENIRPSIAAAKVVRGPERRPPWRWVPKSPSGRRATGIAGLSYHGPHGPQAEESP